MKLGDRRCNDVTCDKCPLHIICREDDLEDNSTLFEELEKWRKDFQDSEVYQTLLNKLNQEYVEEKQHQVFKRIKDCTFEDIHNYIMCKGVDKQLAVPRMKKMPSSILMFHAAWNDCFRDCINNKKQSMQLQAFWQIATSNFEQYKEQLSDKVLNTTLDILVEVDGNA